MPTNQLTEPLCIKNNFRFAEMCFWQLLTPRGSETKANVQKTQGIFWR